MAVGILSIEDLHGTPFETSPERPGTCLERRSVKVPIPERQWTFPGRLPVRNAFGMGTEFGTAFREGMSPGRLPGRRLP